MNSSLPYQNPSKTDANLETKTNVIDGKTVHRQVVEAFSVGSVYNRVQSVTNAIYKYIGFASATGWKIKRKTLATSIWMVAEGDGDYETAFADRANKTYSYA